MKTIIKKPLRFTVTTTLCLVIVILFVVNGCDKSDILPKTDNNVSWTPCKQGMLKSSELLDKVDVEFTKQGVQITYYDFEVPCDFTTVNVTHTFVNGVLNITQQGFPNQANCICYTDVSYTINGILQNEVNVIFINGVQVYCYNEEIPYVECVHEGDYMDTVHMEGIGYLFVNSIPAELQKDNNVMYIIYDKENNSTTFSSVYSFSTLPAIRNLNGNICNFPDFAKEWEISTEGKKIYYKGEFYVGGGYNYPFHMFGDLILTTFKIKM